VPIQCLPSRRRERVGDIPCQIATKIWERILIESEVIWERILIEPVVARERILVEP